MRYQTAFVSGRHLAAARVLAGLKQVELASLARLHVSSIKRFERMDVIEIETDYVTSRIEKALKEKGVTVSREPQPEIRLSIQRRKSARDNFPTPKTRAREI
jgi:ribosome-binding protein aMBF1 (putative translation factor)